MKPLTPAQEQHIASGISSEEIKEFLHNIAVENGEFRRDIYSPDVLIPVQQTPTPQETKVTKTLVINGQRYTLEGNSEAELAAAETNLLRGLWSNSAQETVAIAAPAAEQPQARDSQGRFIARTDAEKAAMRAAEDAELRSRMVRGEITPHEFAMQSHEMEDFMRDRYGLRPASETNFEQSWTTATQSFLQRHPEWVGGSENQSRMAKLLEENNLDDGIDGDKLAALEAAYEFAKENDLLVIPPEVAAQRSISELNDVEAIRAAARRSLGLPEESETGSNFWGR